MSRVSHESATRSHYDKEAKHYDAFNEHNTRAINTTVEKILNEYNVKTILDLSCGTGSQVFWLTKKGFDVTGYDINEKMISIARETAAQNALDISLEMGDMRTTRAGQFDAVITIFNSIGHLTKQDFEQAMNNIHHNLKPGGFYIFDIFNLNYLLTDDNITKLTIDWLKKSGDCTAREIQYSTISEEGILASYDIYHEQQPGQEPIITQAFQTLQVYNKDQLHEMLNQQGFSILKQCDVDGSQLHDTQTERILTIAQKI
jgi:ubiquinone/menaquinone biosynthesis C-methylase UbiE